MFLYCALFKFLIGSSIFVFENAKENVLPTIKIIFNTFLQSVFLRITINNVCIASPPHDYYVKSEFYLSTTRNIIAKEMNVS